MKELTKAESEIMNLLWDIQKGFVKDILEKFDEPKPAYNTVSTIVRILEKKGFIGHNTYGNTHEYFPIINKDDYTKFSLRNIVTNYFSSSYKNMVSFFVEKEKLSVNEIDEILKILSEQKENKIKE